MLNAIVAALTALPELITLGKQLYGFYMTMTGQTVKEKVQNTSKALSFLADIDPEKIGNEEASKKRTEAARGIRDLIRRNI